MINKIRELEEKTKEIMSQLEELKKENKVKLSSLKPGDTFWIADKEFIVLFQEPFANSTHVISKDLWGGSVEFGNSRDYRESSLKKYIEENIQPVIENEVGAENIIEHEVDLVGVDGKDIFEKFLCKVRPITFDEFREFGDLLINGDMNYLYWTCSSWWARNEDRSTVAVVAPSGLIFYNYCSCDYGVRPFCILKSNIFVSTGK